MFAAADDLAQLVIEQALRDRFVEFHGGTVPFQDADGTIHNVPAASFQALYEEIHAEGRLRKPKRWRLRLAVGIPLRPRRPCPSVRCTAPMPQRADA
jgi:hypothetical protein